MKNKVKIIKHFACTEYLLNGELHREDGPAIELANGTKIWYIHGKCHREDGPACEYTDGDEEYWHRGYRIDMIDDKLIEIEANLSGIEIVKYLLMIQSLR